MAPKYLYRSPLPDLVLPEIQDITTTLFERPEVDKSAPALIDGLTGRSWTYGELIDRYERLARSLASKYAAKEGEVICYLTPNNMELVAFLYATFRTGAAVSGVSTLYVPAEISFQVSDTGAKTVVVHPDYLGRLEEAIKKFSLNVSIILTAPKAGASYPTIEDLTQAGSQLPPLPRVQPRKDLGERVAEIFYSSGTTGRAKGVVQLHRNVIAAFLGVTAMETGWMIPGKDIQLNVLALNHIYGCNKVLHPSFYGRITTILLPTYTLATFMEAIQRFKVTRLAIVPPQAIALLKDPLVDKYDYSSVRFITCGAAVLGREMHEALYNKFRVLTKQGYGMTETTASICMTPAQGEPVYGSVGQLLPSFTAWIRDPETGESLPPNKKGEIMLKGPAVVTRYLNRPDATAEAFVDGYLASGDIGWIDENGNWAIADRIKEMIKTNGLQVAPAEVEDLILQSSHDIVECAVVAGPHATAGHVPVAYIVLRDRSLAQKAIDTATEFLKERMANYKIPRTWRIVDGLTKTASGKVMRRAMGDLETNGHWDSKAKL